MWWKSYAKPYAIKAHSFLDLFTPEILETDASQLGCRAFFAYLIMSKLWDLSETHQSITKPEVVEG